MNRYLFYSHNTTNAYPSTAYYHRFTGTVASLSTGQRQVMDSLPAFHSGAIRSMLRPFHVPISLSVHIPLGCPLATCNGVRVFIAQNFTRPHIRRNYTAAAFLPPIRLEPFIRGFVSLKRHSHHGYFIDLRHIICTACLQAGFHSG